MAIQPVEVVLQCRPPRLEVRLIARDAPVGGRLRKLHPRQRTSDGSGSLWRRRGRRCHRGGRWRCIHRCRVHHCPRFVAPVDVALSGSLILVMPVNVSACSGSEIVESKGRRQIIRPIFIASRQETITVTTRQVAERNRLHKRRNPGET